MGLNDTEMMIDDTTIGKEDGGGGGGIIGGTVITDDPVTPVDPSDPSTPIDGDDDGTKTGTVDGDINGRAASYIIARMADISSTYVTKGNLSNNLCPTKANIASITNSNYQFKPTMTLANNQLVPKTALKWESSGPSQTLLSYHIYYPVDGTYIGPVGLNDWDNNKTSIFYCDIYIPGEGLLEASMIDDEFLDLYVDENGMVDGYGPYDYWSEEYLCDSAIGDQEMLDYCTQFDLNASWNYSYWDSRKNIWRQMASIQENPMVVIENSYVVGDIKYLELTLDFT